MRSPFKFLDAYTVKDKEYFFGREQETDALYEMVFRTPLILLFGLSGTGKTSLVQCGLASRFDGPEWYPFYIRREDNINHSVRAALAEALDEPETDASLPELVGELFEEYLSPAYLIFDQFEELFILGSVEEQQRFARDIKELLDAELPCKIIFVMREEYLGRLYHFEKVIPTLFDFRLRVEPMNNSRVKEVLSASFRNFNIGLAPPPAEERLEEIIKNLSGEKALIQLPYLQVYLDLFWREDYQRTYGDTEPPSAAHPPLTFTREEIEAFGPIEKVLEKFLQQQQGELAEEMKEAFPELPEEAIRRVLDVFVTAEGTKRPVRFERTEGGALLLEEAVARLIPEISPAAITACLESMEQRRLLRFGDEAIELAHDSLAALIDEQRTDEQRQLNEVKLRIAAAYREWQRTGEFLSRKQLISLESLLPKIQLDTHLERFVADSEAEADRKEQAAEARRQAELDKERRLRGEADKSARRAKQQSRVAIIISLVVVVLAALAGLLYRQAQDAKATALDNLSLAKRNQAVADSLAGVAQDSALAASVQRDSAQIALQLADKERQRADAQAERAQLALADLQQASGRIAAQLVEDATELIYERNHPEALEKLRAALPLNKRTAEVARGLLELAFFYNEAGKYDLALGIADTVLQLRSSGRARALYQQALGNTTPRPLLNQALKALDGEWYDALEKRYYPEMIDVKGGTFCLGSLVAVEDCDTSRLVTIDDFRMARTETTVWQYYLFATATGRSMQMPSWGWAGDNPVVNVSWYDAIAYSNWLSAQRGLDPVYQLDSIPKDPNELDDISINWGEVPDWKRSGYRMPTEAEWEYAARGGIRQDTFTYSGSDSLDLVGWYWGNSNKIFGVNRPHPVAGKQPNGLGLYDMSGNVWEWAWEADDSSVLRGGSWYDFDYSCRVVIRIDSSNPSNRDDDDGFRLVQGLPFGF